MYDYYLKIVPTRIRTSVWSRPLMTYQYSVTHLVSDRAHKSQYGGVCSTVASRTSTAATARPASSSPTNSVRSWSTCRWATRTRSCICSFGSVRPWADWSPPPSCAWAGCALWRRCSGDRLDQTDVGDITRPRCLLCSILLLAFQQYGYRFFSSLLLQADQNEYGLISLV